MSKFQEIEARTIEIENWLNANQEHPRSEEGMEKLRMLMRELNTEYIRENEPKQGVLI